MVLQSAILTMFIITKTQVKMPQKSKMERIDLIEQKQLVRIAHELLKLNWCHFKVPKWLFEILNMALWISVDKIEKMI